MSSLEDRLPLAAVLSMEEDEPFDAGLRALSALAAGVAVMQLMVAAAHDQLVPAAFWAATVAVTAACVLAWPLSDRHRWLRVGAGSCSVVVWLALALQAPVAAMPVALAMAALSGAMARHLVTGGGPVEGPHPEVAERDDPSEAGEPRAWIDDDLEGFLPA